MPGLGHLYIGRFRRAVLWMSPAILAVVGVVLATRLRRTDIIGVAISPTALWGLLAVNGIAVFWRAGAAIDAYTQACSPDERSEPRRVVGFAAWTLLAIVLLAPHVVVSQYTFSAITLVETVFVDDAAGPPPEPVIPIGTDADIVPDPVVHRYDVAGTPESSSRNLILRPGIGDPLAAATRDEILASGAGVVTTPFAPLTERVGTDRITILLAGGDGGPGRGGMRTDTMMVATLDTVTGKAALFGFPRNLGQTPLPRSFATAFVDLEKKLIPKPPQDEPQDQEAPVDGTTEAPPPEEAPPEEPVVEPPPFESCRCFPDQLNALYPFTRRWTGTFPNEVDPGMAALKETLENVMKLRIDYYALVDMGAFVDLVDAIGGVDVYVQNPLESEVSPPREGDPWAHVKVDVGWNHLDGPEALAYSRARKGSSDYARMQRQRCMLRAVAAKADSLTLLRSFSAIVRAVEGSVVTNIPLSFAPDLLTAAANLNFDDIETIGFVPGYWAPERDYGGRPILDVGRVRAKVRSVINDQSHPETVEVSASECDA